MRKKLAVIFPGVGYTCAKPLLYYTAQLAGEYGYEVIRLDYGEDIHSFRGRTMDDLIPVIDQAVRRVLPELGKIPVHEYEEILMISKSIGTVAACRVQEELGWEAKHFWITPIPLTVPYLEKAEGCFVAGTGDPYISEELVEETAGKYPGKAGKIFEHCNHSLEIPGDTAGNLRNLQETVEILRKCLFTPEKIAESVHCNAFGRLR